jgi:hypothetical protein
MATIWIEFFRPTVSGGTFVEVMKAIKQMPKAQRVRKNPETMGIFSTGRKDHQFWGEAAKIRTPDLPVVFVYDSRLDVIAIQKSQMLRAFALQNFLSELTSTPISFRPILRQDAWDRFQKMPLVTKINFKLHRPRKRSVSSPAVERALGHLEDFGGVVVDVEISVGSHRNRNLNIDTVWKVLDVFKSRPEDFERLRITGVIDSTGGWKSGTIDFIKDTLRHRDDDVRYNSSGRRLDLQGCRLALKKALSIHRTYLQRYDGGPAS